MPPEDRDEKHASAASTAHESEVDSKLVLGPYHLLQPIGAGGMEIGVRRNNRQFGAAD